MKIGFVSQIGDFPEDSWETEFQIAQQKKLSHLEIVVSYPYFGPSNYKKQKLEKLRRYSEVYDVPLIIHLLPWSYDFSGMGELRDKAFDIASESKEIRQFSMQEIRKTVEIARRLKAGLIVVHGGKFSSTADYIKRLEMARSTLEQLDPELREVRLAIENMPILNNERIQIL